MRKAILLAASAAVPLLALGALAAPGAHAARLAPAPSVRVTTCPPEDWSTRTFVRSVEPYAQETATVEQNSCGWKIEAIANCAGPGGGFTTGNAVTAVNAVSQVNCDPNYGITKAGCRVANSAGSFTGSQADWTWTNGGGDPNPGTCP